MDQGRIGLGRIFGEHARAVAIDAEGYLLLLLRLVNGGIGRSIDNARGSMLAECCPHGAGVANIGRLVAQSEHGMSAPLRRLAERTPELTTGAEDQHFHARYSRGEKNSLSWAKSKRTPASPSRRLS